MIAKNELIREISEKHFQGRQLGEIADIVLKLWFHVMLSCPDVKTASEFANAFEESLNSQWDFICDHIKEKKIN